MVTLRAGVTMRMVTLRDTVTRRMDGSNTEGHGDHDNDGPTKRYNDSDNGCDTEGHVMTMMTLRVMETTTWAGVTKTIMIMRAT